MEEDFQLEAQMCLSMFPNQVPLKTHGTHHGIHHWHPLPLWFLHQGNCYHTQFILLGQIQMFMFMWRTPNSSIFSTASPKVKIVKGQGVGACSLARNISGVTRHVGTPRWGLGQMTSGSTIHMDKIHHNLDFEGSHHLPPYNILCAWPQG